MRVILITGDQLRHKWVSWELAKQGWALSVYREPSRPNTMTQARIERELLSPPFYEPPTPCAWPGQPDLVLFYGCRIIDPAQFHCPVLNLHLGLSPYYRGSGTNFWALHDGKPECVGATIHLATMEVDAGPMLAQCRPQLIGNESCHEVGVKALMAAVKVLPSVIARERVYGLSTAGVHLFSEQPERVCKRKDYTPDAEARMQQQLAGGLLPDYLAHKAARDAAYPIVEA